MYHPNNKKGGAPKVKEFRLRELNQVMYPFNPQNPFNPNSSKSFCSSTSNMQNHFLTQSMKQ